MGDGLADGMGQNTSYDLRAAQPIPIGCGFHKGRLLSSDPQGSVNHSRMIVLALGRPRGAVENTVVSEGFADDPPSNRHRRDPPVLGQCRQTSRMGRVENHPNSPLLLLLLLL